MFDISVPKMAKISVKKLYPIADRSQFFPDFEGFVLKDIDPSLCVSARV